jgi:putative Holliday junction resolvase
MMPEPGRVMAIDYGTKRIGVAVSDPMRILASGRRTLDQSPDLITRINELVRSEAVVLLVVGMPYAPDGGTGKKGAEVSAFVERLRAALSIPVETWDESSSTVEAHSAMRISGMKRKRKQQKGKVDEIAATVILQGYLDHSTSHP